MKKISLLCGILLVFNLPLTAQVVSHELTLQQAHDALHTHFPIIMKYDLISRVRDYNQKVNDSMLYPDLTISGSASYQSHVTEVPFAAPGSTPINFSKDHYNVSLDLSQSIYNGGRVGALNSVEESRLEANRAELEVSLHQVQDQMEEVFFGILLMKKQKEVQVSLIRDLEQQLSAVSARVQNGVLLPGNEWTLKAEMIRIKQQVIQTESTIKAGYQTLEELTGLDLSALPDLKIPEYEKEAENVDLMNERPEYDFFQANRLLLQNQKRLLEAEKQPVVSAFARTAYSRPGLDAFSDDLEFWWIVGIRAQWNLRGWTNSSRKQEVLTLQQKSLDADTDAFTRQLNAGISDAQSRIDGLKQQIELDEQVLELRNKVVDEKKHLLDEGAITSSEWLTELLAANRAKMNLELHQIELSKAQTELRTKKGISWK